MLVKETLSGERLLIAQGTFEMSWVAVHGYLVTLHPGGAVELGFAHVALDWVEAMLGPKVFEQLLGVIRFMLA